MDTSVVQLKPTYDDIAPDKSQIYFLARGNNSSLCQCVLPCGAITQAVSHKTVEEIWFFLEGYGEVWRSNSQNCIPVSVQKGSSLVIPVKTVFQFRNLGDVPLKFMIVTTPPWPGDEEAKKEVGLWQSRGET